MDESRKQFLEWFGEEFESINNSEELHVQAIKMIAWQSWIKSRAAIEIKLPPKAESSPYEHYMPHYTMDADSVESAIRAAGIKVKE